MNLLQFCKKVYNRLNRTNLKFSFSQCGEDVLIEFIIHSLGKVKIQYFDIGTNDPIKGNNTYLLYLNGITGVCVEPNPYFYKKISRSRPNDILIKGGLALKSEKTADFYLMDDSVLSTFSLEEVENMELNHNRKRIGVIKSPLYNINELFKEYLLKDHEIVLSIDVEGLDFEILKSVDFSVYKPSIICIETIGYTTNLSGLKREEIFDFLYSQDYKLYADTFINSIFVLNTF